MDGGVMGLRVKGGSGETAGHFMNSPKQTLQ